MDRIRISTVDIGLLADLFPSAGDDLWTVVATTARGEVFLYAARDLNEPQARRLAAAVELSRTIDPDLWSYWRTVYGSPAFEAEEAEVAMHLLTNGRADDLPDDLRELC